jgi:hypothetical protein
VFGILIFNGYSRHRTDFLDFTDCYIRQEDPRKIRKYGIKTIYKMTGTLTLRGSDVVQNIVEVLPEIKLIEAFNLLAMTNPEIFRDINVARDFVVRASGELVQPTNQITQSELDRYGFRPNTTYNVIDLGLMPEDDSSDSDIEPAPIVPDPIGVEHDFGGGRKTKHKKKRTKKTRKLIYSDHN